MLSMHSQASHKPQVQKSYLQKCQVVDPVA
jgi:hypothetical protein